MTGAVAGARGQARGILAMLEREVLAAGRGWPLLFAGFAEPVLYLAAFGLGVATLVGPVVDDAGRAGTYLEFVAPAVVVTSAAGMALFESTYPVWQHLRKTGLFAMIGHTSATDAAVPWGVVCGLTVRGAVYCGATVAVLLASGLVAGPVAALWLAAVATLTCFAVVPWGFVVAVLVREHQDLDVFHALALPLFLFSGAFFPLHLLPHGLGDGARSLPSSWCVALAREAAAGRSTPHLVLGCGALFLAGTAAGLLARWTYRRASRE